VNNYIKILRSGILTTIQDLKRIGFKKYGIPKSGPMDENSHILANWLVNKNFFSETIEMTFYGPKIKFYFDTCIGLCGAETPIFLNNKLIEMNRTININKGDVLDIKNCINGNRIYLSIAGKMLLNKDFNSLSTYDKINIGGINGKKLIKDDTIKIRPKKIKENRILPEILIKRHNETIIRVIKGPEYNLVDKNSINSLSKEFKITPSSDRMGIRLSGNKIHLRNDVSIDSSVVSEGSVQLPPNGNPIILMRDAQTTGGYPRIGVVSRIDISKISQVKPNEKIKLKFISMDEGEKLILHEKKILQSKLKSV